MKANMSRSHVSYNVTVNPIYVLCWNLNIAKGSSRAVSWPSFLNVLLLETIKKAGSHMAKDSTGRQSQIGKNH